MEETYYLVIMWGCVEPERRGEYSSVEAQEEEARRIWKAECNPGFDNIFWLNVEDGEPFIGSFTNQFFEDDDDAGN